MKLIVLALPPHFLVLFSQLFRRSCCCLLWSREEFMFRSLTLRGRLTVSGSGFRH